MSHHTHDDVKFVQRFEMAVMQFAVLEKAMKQGEVTRENLQQMFKGNLQMKKDHLDTCLDILVQENHLTKDGNKYRITDDGREDVQQVQRLAVELSSIANEGVGATQKTGGQTQQATTGAGTTGGSTGGSTGGTTSGTTGGSVENRTTADNMQNQPGQPKGGPGNATGKR